MVGGRKRRLEQQEAIKKQNEGAGKESEPVEDGRRPKRHAPISRKYDEVNPDDLDHILGKISNKNNFALY